MPNEHQAPQGLTAEELEDEQAAELPDREAMSLVDLPILRGGPADPTFPLPSLPAEPQPLPTEVTPQ
jgi:hypothetical protein